MGLTSTEPDTESSLLLPTTAATTTTTTTTTTTNSTISQQKIPKDTFHLAYIIYFTLGLGFLLPWNAFITAVDYFSYIYPDVSVDRIFSVAYMVMGLACLVVIILFYAHKSDAYLRINLGLGLFIVALLVVPVMDAVYIKGRVGLYDGFYVTVGALALSGMADALVQGGLIGAAGELPERYMQAVVAGTAASGTIS
jgi:equilibrative nucleoside transporter 1/2/3